MMITNKILASQQTEHQRPFSLRLYLLIVFGLSWPFQIAYALWGNTSTSSFLLSSLSMVMVAVGTYIAGHYVFRDGFKNAGWHWGKPRHYLGVFALALFIFAVPVLLETVLGLHNPPEGISASTILISFLNSFMLTLIPGFSEEFGWRAYMLPHLAQRYPLRKALLLHGFIWWVWHIPALVRIGLHVEGADANPWFAIFVTILISLLPAMMNAILFAFVWHTSRSLAVAAVYHSAYDEVRDALQRSIGFGPLVSIWEMVITTLLGVLVLLKANSKMRSLDYQRGKKDS